MATRPGQVGYVRRFPTLASGTDRLRGRSGTGPFSHGFVRFTALPEPTLRKHRTPQTARAAVDLLAVRPRSAGAMLPSTAPLSFFVRFHRIAPLSYFYNRSAQRSVDGPEPTGPKARQLTPVVATFANVYGIGSHHMVRRISLVRACVPLITCIC